MTRAGLEGSVQGPRGVPLWPLFGCVVLSAALWMPASLHYATAPPPGLLLGLALQLAKLASWLVPEALYARWALSPRWSQALRLVPARRVEGRVYATSALACVAFLFAVELLQRALTGQPGKSVGEVLSGVTVLIVVGSAVEEVTFRGLILRLLEARLSPGRANAVCAGLFVLVHTPVWWSMGLRAELVVVGASLFVLAYLLGWLAQRTDSIWIGTVLHALNNALASG